MQKFTRYKKRIHKSFMLLSSSKFHYHISALKSNWGAIENSRYWRKLTILLLLSTKISLNTKELLGNSCALSLSLQMEAILMLWWSKRRSYPKKMVCITLQWSSLAWTTCTASRLSTETWNQKISWSTSCQVELTSLSLETSGYQNKILKT